MTHIMATIPKDGAKFENLTFRLEAPVMEALRHGVDEVGGSLNALANRQLLQYAEWDRLGDKMGYITLRNRTLRNLLNRLSEEDVAAVAREEGLTTPREFIMFHWRTLNVENLIRFIELYAKYGRNYELEVHKEDGEYNLMLFHRMSEKWSIYLEAYLTTALESLLGIKPRSYRTEQSVSLAFRAGDGRQGKGRGTVSTAGI